MGPFTFIRRLAFLVFLLPVAQLANVRAADAGDNYDIALHSRSLEEQREALKAILADPEKYVPRIQQSLRDYPKLLRNDRRAADRAVYISALVRDPSFAPILVKNLGVPDVVEYCEYACPAVFALTVQACFAGWKPPANPDPRLSTVYDLKHAIDYVSHMSLEVQPIEAVLQGPGAEKHRREHEDRRDGTEGRKQPQP
jgi:hypothetical protein